METMLIDETKKEAWEQYVWKHPDSVAWQSYAWYSVLRNHYPVEFIPVAAADGQQIRGVLPLYRVGSKRGRNMLISVPYAVAGGILADNDEAEALLVNKAISLAKEYGSQGIAFKQYKRQLAGSFKNDNGFYNRELDLSGGIEGVWAGLDDRNRAQIEQARTHQLVLEYPATDTNAFHQLLLRQHHRNGVPCVSRRWIEDLIGFKLYTAAIVKLNGRPAAGTLVKQFKDTVSFPFTWTAQDDETHRTAAYDLYWKLIRLFIAQGTRICHSGRIPANNDVEAYRLGWGGQQHGYHYQYYPGGSAVRSESTKKGKKRELFEACWRRMPVAVAARLGPSIVRHFP